MENQNSENNKTVMAITVIATGIKKRCRKSERHYIEKHDMDYDTPTVQAFYDKHKDHLVQIAQNSVQSTMRSVEKVQVQLMKTEIQDKGYYISRLTEPFGDDNLTVNIA